MIDKKVFKKRLMSSELYDHLYHNFFESNSKMILVTLHDNGFNIGYRSKLDYSEENFKLLMQLAKLSNLFQGRIHD